MKFPPVMPGTVNSSHWPRRESVDGAVRDLFRRRYFSNNGPLVQEFERTLCEYLAMPHVICVVNEASAWMLLCHGLGLSGEVLVPATLPRSLAAAFAWSGLTPRPCDVIFQSASIDPVLAAAAVTPTSQMLLATNIWGGAPLAPLAEVARQLGLVPVLKGNLLDQQANDCSEYEATVWGFEERDIINALGGACIATRDAELAARLRAIRNFASSERPVSLRMNGKMSEMQAALGLLTKQAQAEAVATIRRQALLFWESLDRMAGPSVRRQLCHASALTDIVLGAPSHFSGMCVGDLLPEWDKGGGGWELPFSDMMCTPENDDEDDGHFAIATTLAQSILRIPTGLSLPDHFFAEMAEWVADQAQRGGPRQ